MRLIALVAALAAIIVYVVSSSDTVDHHCGVDTNYQKGKHK